MIISMRNINGKWHWELYSMNRRSGGHDGQYASGMSNTWKEMISFVEVAVAELEKKNENK